VNLTMLYIIVCAKKGTVGFWKAWRKRFCMQHVKPTGTLNGKSGDTNVRNEFTEYYKSIQTIRKLD